MQTGGEFLGQHRVDPAMSFYPAKPGKGSGADADMHMGAAPGPPAGMAVMLGRIIADFQHLWLKCLCQ